MKEYFPHDYNARNDPKIENLLMEHGVAGIGVFWCIVEMLYEQEGKIPLAKTKAIAFALHVEHFLVLSVISDFELFEADDMNFWSDAINKRIGNRNAKQNEKEELREKRSYAARSKWGNNLQKENAKTRSERLSAARLKGTHTKEEWDEMKSFFGHCVICGKNETEVKLVKDHIIPLYQGGSDGIDNLQPLCQSCNSRKGPDNQDYRLLFCQMNNIEMPAKWVQNACKCLQNEEECLQNASLKENKRKEDNKENISSFHSDIAKESPAVPSADVTTIKKPKETIEDKIKKRIQREQEFYKELVPYVEIYGKDMIRDFYNYWTEPSKNKTLIKKDQQKTWDTARRLAKWNNKQNYYSNGTHQAYKSSSQLKEERIDSYKQLIASNLNDIAEGRFDYDDDEGILAM